MESANNDFYSSVTQFDKLNDFQGLAAYVSSQTRDVNVVAFSVYRLLSESRLQSSYIIAKIFINSGLNHAILQFAQAIGGLALGKPDDEAQGVAALSIMMDHISAEQYETFYNQIMATPIFRQSEAAMVANDHDKLLRILEILKAGLPLFRKIFDFSAEVPTLDLEDIRRRGREQSKLIKFSSPPAGTPRVERRAVVAIRELVFPLNPNSRTLDIGPRIQTAMNRYGWKTSLSLRQWGGNLEEDYKQIVEVCQRENADVLVFDDHLIEMAISHHPRATMIERLRQTMPSLKIMALQLDSWAIKPELMVSAAALVDAVWALSPGLPVWDDPAFIGKVLQVPLPHAGNYLPPEKPLSSRIVFDGTLKGYNWHRVFWWAATLQKGLPVDWHLTHHTIDGLSALDSYANYMKRLNDTGCLLNLSMRPNLSLVFTARVFEAVMAGALLVQEASSDVDYYLTSGEHYLSFSTFSELRAIGQFIVERPEEAEAIRRAGHEFAVTHYNDEKLIGYIDKHLFYPEHC